MNVVFTIDVEDIEAPEAATAKKMEEQVINILGLASIDRPICWLKQQTNSTYHSQSLTQLQ
jgi:hypothetical protein